MIEYKSKQLSGLEFTDYEVIEIENAKNYFKKIGILFSKITPHIRKLKIANVSFVRLPERLEKILSLGRDSSSKKSFLYRYGLKEGTRLYLEKTEASTMTRHKLEEKYGKERTDMMLSSRGASIENYIDRWGEKEGRIRWNKYLEKRAESYKAKHENGHKFPKYNKEYFVNLYGAEKGSKIYADKIEKQRYKVSRQRYIDEYGDNGIEICRQIKDNNSLSSFVERHGTDIGLEKYVEYCEKQRMPKKQKIQELYPDNWKKNIKNIWITDSSPRVLDSLKSLARPKERKNITSF